MLRQADNTMKSLRFLLFAGFVLALHTLHAQDSLHTRYIGTGAGLAYFPLGQLYGIDHTWRAGWMFSPHFGIEAGIAFSKAQSTDKQHFDLAATHSFLAGLLYAPQKQKPDFRFSLLLSAQDIVRIFGTKDEQVDTHLALSSFTAYENRLAGGLEIGLQYPLMLRNRWLLGLRTQTWLNLEGISTASASLFLGYKF